MAGTLDVTRQPASSWYCRCSPKANARQHQRSQPTICLTAAAVFAVVLFAASSSADATADNEDHWASTIREDAAFPSSSVDIFVDDDNLDRHRLHRRMASVGDDIQPTMTGVGVKRRSLLRAIAAATAEKVAAEVADGIGLDGEVGGQDPCYENDERKTPKRCVPDFDNAAYGRPVEASSTCGSPPVRFCTGGGGGPSSQSSTRSCFVCDASNARRRHPVSYVNDNNNPTDVTCWISEPIFPYHVQVEPKQLTQHHHHYPQHQQLLQRQPQNVTVTISLGKKFEVSSTVA